MDRKSLVTAAKFATIATLALIALTSPGAAQAIGAMIDSPYDAAKLAFAALGTFAAARLASQAFGRGAVSVAELPTFPKYMTSRGLYQLGNWIFIAFASVFFLLLIYEHRQVFQLASMLSLLPAGAETTLLEAANNPTASYLVVIAAIGVIYLFILSKEHPWNVVLMLRDAIYRCISIPQLAGRIVDQIKIFLKVPEAARAEVVAGTPGLAEQDFRKDLNTPDRLWAETCYMKWWLTQGRDAGEDATFFAEQSFGFETLLRELRTVSRAMSAWKSSNGNSAEASLEDLFAQVKNLHSRFARLVACYLIYRNSSNKALAAEALEFGISIKYQRPNNPLKYWVLYLIVLLFAVYIGVYVSAIGYDLAAGQGLNSSQDINRTFQWMMYSTSNYGLAIIVVLLLRLAGNQLGHSFAVPHLITYCWTFVVAFIVGPLGLTLVLHFFGPARFQDIAVLQLLGANMKWGTGPALVCVYISYYLDRQNCADMPSLDQSTATVGWRALNAFGFATGVLLLLLPALMSIGQVPIPDDPWSGAKLRTVASGTLFAMTFALALAAQFCVRDESDKAVAGARAQAAPLRVA
jgi:hypothetical protein